MDGHDSQAAEEFLAVLEQMLTVLRASGGKRTESQRRTLNDRPQKEPRGETDYDTRRQSHPPIGESCCPSRGSSEGDTR